MTRKRLLTPIAIVLSLLLLSGCSTEAVNKLLGLSSEGDTSELGDSAMNESTLSSATKDTTGSYMATDATSSATKNSTGSTLATDTTSSATKVNLYGVATANDATTSATQSKSGVAATSQTNGLFGKITVINGRTITFEIVTVGTNQSTSSTTNTVDTVTGSTKPITSANTTTTVNPYVLTGKLSTLTLSDSVLITVIDSSTGAVVGTSFANAGVGSYIRIKLDATGKISELQIIKLVVTQQTAVVPTPISAISGGEDHENEAEEKEDNEKEDNEKEEEHEEEND